MTENRHQGAPQRESVKPSSAGAMEDSYDQLPREELAEEISHVSSDGRPMRPELSPKRTILLVLGFFVAVLAIAAVLAVLVSWLLGLTVAVLGGAFTLVHPAVWASVQRSREREQAKQRLEAHRGHAAGASAKPGETDVANGR
jgi:hypothetical protein